MPDLSCGKIKNISLFQHILTSTEQTLPPTQTASGTLYQIVQLVKNGANHSLLSCTMTYIGHLRSYVYNFIAITKHTITTLLIFLMFTHMSSTQCNIKDCWQTFPICVINDQLQLCIHPCSNDVKRQWQQCWYHLPIKIIYPKERSFTCANNQ